MSPIWFFVLIPIFTVAFLLIRYRKKVTFLEVGVQLIIAVLLIALCKYIGFRSLVNDKEYWGNLVSDATYYETWNERVSCQHPVYCSRSVGTGKNKRRERYVCGHEHSYDVNYHAPYSEVTIKDHKGNSSTIGISDSFYKELSKKFGNSVFVDLNRNYHTINGNKYVSYWRGDPMKSQNFVTEHTYENRIQCSPSVFNYLKVDSTDRKRYSLFDYPFCDNNGLLPSILGSLVPNKDSAEQKLQFINGDLGSKKQVRVWIVLYRNQPLQAAKMQQAYWRNGNKNELVICIGVNPDNQVQWSYVFSWTEHSLIHSEIRDFVVNQKQLDLVRLSDFLYSEISEKWIRRPFAQFSYITVSPPVWAIVLAVILQILFNVFYSIWAVKNEFVNDESD